MSLNRYAWALETLKRRPVLVACVSAVAASLFAIGYLKSREAAIMAVAEPRPVITAARDIAPGEAIDDGAIRMTKVPARFVQPGAFGDIAHAAGRVAAIPIRAGAHITPANARRAGEGNGVAAICPAGRRAFALALDEAAGSAGFIRPDDLVDVIATFDLGQGTDVRRTTLTIAEGVPVLAVNGETADSLPAKRAPSQSGIFGGQAGLARGSQATAVLAVTPIEAQALSFARDSGSLALILRPFADDAMFQKPPPTTIATITGGHDGLVPIRRQYKEYKGR